MPLRPHRFYFDYAASTPVAPEVFRAMRPYFLEKYGNPGSLHSFGQEALAAVDRARETVALALGAQFREIIFTASATEANNLALRGSVAAGISRLIVSAVEHESVLETARSLGREGLEVIELPVGRDGVVKPEVLQAALDPRVPTLVSIMYANNETGAVQPITRLAKIAREAGALFHSDAVQTFQFLDCKVDFLGVDLLTLSAHKIYGPKGTGALYVRSRKGGTGPRGRIADPLAPLHPLQTGGGQEFGLRSGTENVALIAGFGAAVEYIEKDKDKYARRLGELKERLIAGVRKVYPRARLNGSIGALPHIANFWLPKVRAEDLLIRLDLAGCAISVGSACAARSSQPSHVLRAMGFSEARTRESVRISLGRPTTGSDIARLLKILYSL